MSAPTLPAARLRMAGVPLRVSKGHAVLLLVLGVVFYRLALPSPAPALVAVLALAVTVASVLAHELAHGLVLTRTGGKVAEYRLGLLGAGMVPAGPFPSLRSAAWALAAGPAASAVLAVVMTVSSGVLRVSGAAPVAEWVLLLGAAVNVMVAVVNALPARPLDGGRLAEVGLMVLLDDDVRAARACSWIGAAFGVGVTAVGASPALTGGLAAPGVIAAGMVLVVLNVGAQLVGAGTSVRVAQAV